MCGVPHPPGCLIRLTLTPLPSRLQIKLEEGLNMMVEDFRRCAACCLLRGVHHNLACCAHLSGCVLLHCAASQWLVCHEAAFAMCSTDAQAACALPAPSWPAGGCTLTRRRPTASRREALARPGASVSPPPDVLPPVSLALQLSLVTHAAADPPAITPPLRRRQPPCRHTQRLEGVGGAHFILSSPPLPATSYIDRSDSPFYCCLAPSFCPHRSLMLPSVPV